MDYKKIFHNCLDVNVQDDVYFPVRFTDKLYQFYRDTGVAQFPERAVQTAGITMEFYTEDKEIEFDFFFTCFARPWITFDIYENDIFMNTLYFEDGMRSGTFLYSRKTEGKGKIVIYMPATADTHFRNFRFHWEPVEEKKTKYLALGCSITQGMEAVHPSVTYANIVKRFLRAEMLNLGIGGFYYDPDSLDEKLPYAPDVITVAYGTNDTAGESSVAEIWDKTARYMEKLKMIYPDKPVNVITPVWRKEYEEDEKFREKADKVRAAIETETEKQGFHLICGRYAVPNSPEFFKDGFLHPDDLGFALYGIYVIQNMEVN